ncbi:MAG: S8 family serine peptidase [Methylicorpusculum sp.]|uniref:S8 family serine peptidase n=1 Tax=Methylicorpusculum sp. TaxID=2713644 RepID=UPI0027290BD5|nr:S8 family serine peptidase [Methylicorpusculum sp.]MDO8937564.1 S8 family serine peptidase [Methylicorpusculum sp.]MDP2203099.1 S8 family serine peptidase [Methylicorpusculum sp.]
MYSSKSRSSDKNQTKHTNVIKPTLTAVLMLGVYGASGLAVVNAAPAQLWKSGQILVKPKAGLSEVEFDSILKKNKGQSKGAIGRLGVHIINVPAQAEAAVVKALSRNPHVEFAELDMAVEASAIPNDPRYSGSWHLPKIQAPTAWDKTKADGIIIAVLDTGIDGAHPDFSGKLLPGWNAVDGSNDTSDINGHGTAVAGTAAAASNNALGVASVAWNAQILPVRISNSTDSYAYWSDIAKGLNWAANQGADVANISYMVTNSSTVTTAAQYMRSKGGLVVVAAGNDGADPGFANNTQMITVSATTSTDEKASWSNFGALIDVAAPGASIQTTTRGGGYANWNGTSFAAPVTAGVVALIMGANPSLTVDEVENVLKASSDKIAGDIHPYYGHGRVNAATAVSMATSIVKLETDTQAPSVTIFSPTGGSTVSGLVQAEVNATDNVGVSEVSLYANGLLVGTDGTSPYQFSWDSKQVADGNVTLTAVAVDAIGNQGSSAKVVVAVKNNVVVDQQAPTVTISNPANGSKIAKTVAISVSAKDDVSVANVKLYIDGKLVGSVNGSSLSYNWNTNKEKVGAHTIDAIATDTSNKTAKQTITVYK